MNEIFIESSRLGTRILTLEGGRLEISGGVGLKKLNLSVALCDVSPHFESIRFRCYPIIYRPLILAAILAWPTWWFYNQDMFPKEMGIIPGMFVLVFFGVAIRGIPMIEVTRFYDSRRNLLFDIIIENKQADEAYEFVEKIRRQIDAIAEGPTSMSS